MTFELIANPILRLLVYFLSAAVVALSSAVVYLYIDRRNAAKELTAINNEAVKGYLLVGKSLEAMKEHLEDLHRNVMDHLLKKQ